MMGLLRSYPSNRWPDWFRLTLLELQPEPAGPFPASYPVTQAGDVRLVPTPGHIAGHLFVLVTTPEVSYFLARRCLVYPGVDAPEAGRWGVH
ncbi:MAG: hypothetical protein AB1801_12060 [Chloroflexota bacterium]